MKNKFSIAMTLAVIMAMLVNSLALADDIVPDGDVVASGNQSTVNLGTVTPGQIIGTAASFTLICSTKNHVDQGQTLTLSFSLSGSTIPAGGSLTATNASIGPIPVSWPDDTTGGGTTNCGSPSPTPRDDNGNSSVTITAPMTAGPHTFVVRYTFGSGSLSPAGAGDSNAVQGNHVDVTYTLTVVAPPTDSTPPVITKVVTGTLGNNGWYTSDVSVDWTVSDPESSFTTTGCVDTTINTDTTGTTSSCSATSAGGTSSDSVTIKRDATAPSISGAASPAPNAAGWNNTDVSVTFSCSDATSGVASCGPNTTLTNNGADQSASGNAVDNAGNTASTTVSNIDIDKELPTITASVPTPNANGWYNGSVIATFSCSDAYSGVASCEGPHTFSAEGSSSFTGNATDVADNANSTNVSVMIDTTAPVIALVSRTPANANGWNNGDVELEWSCTDGGSGVVEASVFASVTTEGENQSATGTCEDLAGNTSSDTQTGINIDLTAPTASAAASPAPNGAGWNNTNVTVSFTGLDALSGIDFCDTAVILSSEGAAQSASGTCTDNAGNVSALATASGINIDKTDPSVSATASPAPNANGWNKTDVTVSFSGTDALSGIASCDAAIMLSSEGADQSATGSCTDNAGNSASATASNIDIDKTAPTVSLVGGPANGASYYFGSVPAASTCSASDALSGLDGTCTVSGYSAAVGSHTVSASATDKAGNSNSVSATYTVLAWTISGFYQPVDMSPAAPATIVWNTVKGGSTVPLKFEVFAGATELTNTAIVSAFSKQVACGIAGPEDTIEVLATGGTSLRYDTVGGQFIYNWQTPKLPGKCYAVTMTTQDGSSITAYFKLK